MGRVRLVSVAVVILLLIFYLTFQQHTLPAEVRRTSVLRLSPIPVLLPRPPCPERYVVAGRTFGRHHNQLHETLNVIAWARSMNRTAVIGPFHSSGKWHDFHDLYNTSGLQRHFCAVTAAQFAERWGATTQTAVCAGDTVNSTGLDGTVGRCTILKGIPSRYGTYVDRPYSMSRAFLRRAVAESANATLLVLCARLAYFMRPGLAEAVAVMAQLRPSRGVEERLQRAAADVQLDVRLPYAAVHLRAREGGCLAGMAGNLREDPPLASLHPEDKAVIFAQCNPTEFDVARVLSTMTGAASAPLFLASDGQNPALERAMRERGALKFPADSSLLALAVDFFMMARATWFTGNQLSSVTQNVCVTQNLGRGGVCHGFVERFTRHHARPLDLAHFITNLNNDRGGAESSA